MRRACCETHHECFHDNPPIKSCRIRFGNFLSDKIKVCPGWNQEGVYHPRVHEWDHSLNDVLNEY